MRTKRLRLAVVLLVAGCGASSSSGSPASSSTGQSPSTSATFPSPASTPTPTPDPLAALKHSMEDLRATRLQAEIEVSGSPDWQASTEGTLWVGTGNVGVARIDETTNKVVATVDVAQPCLSLAAAYGSVWSPSCQANEVDRIDPKKNDVVARISVPGIPPDGEGQLVAAYGSIWLFTDANGTLVRIDPKSNRIAATYDVGADGVALVAAGGMLWATAPSKDAVLQIDMDGHVVRTIPVGRGPRFETADEGGVWVLGQGDGDVTRIDPKAGRVVATVALRVPGNGGCIAIGGGSVWITMPGTPLSRIDAATNAVIEQFEGAGGDCISFAAGSVWLSNSQQGTVWRIRP